MITWMHMTKVTVQYGLARPIQDDDAQAIADAHSVYGIARVKLTPALDQITVDYDASRLSPREVEAALIRVGLPIERASLTTAS